MRHCDKCGIDFSGDLERCPLCQAELVGEASAPMFPPNVLKRSGAIAMRVIAFVTGVAIIVMLFLTRMVELPSDVVFTVCLALLINYAFVRHIIGHAPDFLRLVARYFLVLLACALLGFVFTGSYAWSTFVVPGISLAALVTDAVLVCVFRKDFVTGYAKYLLLDVVFGLVPLAFAAGDLVWTDIPAQISALVACVLLLGLLVFEREPLASELRKLFAA